MTPKEQYQKALESARAGDYLAAKKILSKMNHPKASELLLKVDAALAKQKPAKKPLNRAVFVIGGTVLVLVLLIGALAIGNTIYLNMQANQQQARQRAADMYCHGLFAVEYIELEREAFDTACEEEARLASWVYDAEIDLCLSQSQNGQLRQRLLECMEAEGVIMLGFELRDALEASKPDKPGD